MSDRIDRQPEIRPPGKRAALVVACVLLFLMALTLFLRAWQLNTIPPGLFGDEAQSGLDVQAWLRGESRNFFPHHLGGETLYGYLSVPFVALWNGLPLGIRFVSALMGMLMIPALFLAGRALWREQPRTGTWAGLVAAALWAVNYWPQSVNRIGFQVNTQPFVLTLAVVAWLAWTQRPARGRAVAFGFLAGLTLMTYPAARITPVLWPLLYLALEPRVRKAVRPGLLWAIGVFTITVIPLAVAFVQHPYYVNARSSTFAALGASITLADRLRLWLSNALQVAAVFVGGPGDPAARHNLPGRPAFAPYLAALFIVGVLFALWGLRRREQRSWTLLLWLAVLCIPAIVAADANPHYLRLLGALPAALLLMAWPLARLIEWSWKQNRYLAAAVLGVLVVLLAVEGLRTGRDYFVAWGKDTDLYYDYQVDVWGLGERITSMPGAIGVVPVDPAMPHDFIEHSLAYGFPDSPLYQKQVREEDIEKWLQATLGGAGGAKILVPVWHEGPEVGADAKGLLQFYLGREGVLENRQAFRGYDLLTYVLDRNPQFEAAGNQVNGDGDFSPSVKLRGAHWGVAKPNGDSDGTSAAAGTPVWAILTWELQNPSPDLVVTLDLVDEAGHRLNSAETPLLNAERKPVSQWQPGESGQSYHLVTVPAAQLPGNVALESRVYRAGSLMPLIPQTGTPRGSVPVAQALVTPTLEPQDAAALAIPRPLQARFEPGLVLLGTDTWPDEIGPGQKLTIRLWWQVEQSPASAQPFSVALGGTDVSATVQIPAGLPAGQVVYTYADLELPPDLATGAYDLVLAPKDGRAAVSLGHVTVAGRPRVFTAPAVATRASASFGDAITLIGTDAGGDLRVAPGEPIALTLIWQALGTPNEDLVRFVHLLGQDGRPLAQQDTVPCEGTCPAASWVAGEFLSDKATFTLPVDVPPGTYSMGVGWTNPAAGWKRLPGRDTNGQLLANDLAILPINVVVGSQ